MATRAWIKIKYKATSREDLLYNHWDGYSEGVIIDAVKKYIHRTSEEYEDHMDFNTGSIYSWAEWYWVCTVSAHGNISVDEIHEIYYNPDLKTKDYKTFDEYVASMIVSEKVEVDKYGEAVTTKYKEGYEE